MFTPRGQGHYLVSRSISQGRRAGLISLAGTALGFIVYMLVANLGRPVIFVIVPWVFIGFKAAGVTPTALEFLRDQHDRTHLAMILIVMPGIDEHFRHYPQL